MASALAVLVFVVLAFTTHVRSGAPAWQQSFREGVRAFDRRQWDVAAEMMNRALLANPDASADMVTVNGGYRVAYMPAYYRAAALAQLGDCDRARATLLGAPDGLSNSNKSNLIDHTVSLCGDPRQ